MLAGRQWLNFHRAWGDDLQSELINRVLIVCVKANPSISTVRIKCLPLVNTKIRTIQSQSLLKRSLAEYPLAQPSTTKTASTSTI